jgi:hypothetical protein
MLIEEQQDLKTNEAVRVCVFVGKFFRKKTGLGYKVLVLIRTKENTRSNVHLPADMHLPSSRKEFFKTRAVDLKLI